MTLILTSHRPQVIEALTEKVLWLEQGRVVTYGDTKTVVDDFMKQIGGIEPEAYPKMGRPKIHVEHCKKYYALQEKVVKAVDDVSFTIHEHEIFGLVGSSGAGKTSLARIIGLIDRLNEGSVKIRIGDTWVEVGRGLATCTRRASEVAPKTVDELVTTHVAILHQEYALYPENTVLENLTSCIGLKMPAELAKFKATFMLEGIGFSELAAEEILPKTHAELSVGERQRVALAQILMKEPAIAILDEPTGSMDPITKKSVADAIRAARRNLGMTLLIITHDADFAYKVCDRIAHMQDGKITTIEDLRTA